MSTLDTLSIPAHSIAVGRSRGLFRAALGQVLEVHRFILAIAVAYAAVGAFVLSQSVEGAVGNFVRGFPYILAGNGVIVASLAGIWTVIFLARTRPAHPFAAIGRVFFRRDVWPVFLARLVILLPAASLVTGTFSAIKPQIPVIHPFVFDALFIKVDAALHAGSQPWELLQPLLGYPLITDAIDRTYYFWFPVMAHTFHWQVYTLRFQALRLQFITAFLLSWIVIGCAAAVSLSSAGPAFLAGLGIDDSAYRGLFAYLRSVDETRSIFALTVQDWLWQAHAFGAAMPLKGISAMPSMHVAIAVLLAFFGWRRHWLLGIGYTAFAALIFLGSIHLGFHYAVDGYVAVAMVVAIWWVSGKIARHSLGSRSAVPG